MKEQWNLVAEIFVDDESGRTVCTPMGDTPEIRKSRARLIVAAPELLISLKNLVGKCRTYGGPKGGKMDLSQALDAIAKAEAKHA